MKDFIIRKATPEDYETLLQFEQGVIAAERPFDPTLKDGSINYYDINALISSASVYLVVAAMDDTLLGCGYARIEDAKPYLRHRRYCYLGFMYTVPEYRGRGINKRIIDALKDWSVANGIFEMRLEVYEENEFALRAYSKAGFTRHMIEMRAGIDEQCK